MGLDVGGGSARCLLLDPDGGAVHAVAEPWQPPRDPADGEADTGVIWSTLARASRAALAAAGARAEDVAGIAVTAMRLGAVALDAADRVLYAGWNGDLRALEIGLELAERHGEVWGPRVGRWPAPNGLPARLVWLEREHPGLRARVASLLALNDQIALRLCGEHATDLSQAGETMLLDVKTGDWAADCLAEIGAARELFPAPRPSGSRLGELRADAARTLGLAPGTPVAVGGGDTQCALLGAGAIEPGSSCVVGGTTAPVQRVLDRPLVDPELRLWTGWHVVPGRWVLESNAGPTGLTLDWAAALLFPGVPDPVAQLLAAAAAAPPGADGMRSTLGAHVWDARRLIPGMRSLSMSSMTLVRAGEGSRGLIARAIIEGLICALRANFEQLVVCAGEPTGDVRLAGGLSRSPLLARLLADALDRPVVAARTPQTSALGAALCAGVGAGILDDLAAGAGLVGEGARVEPEPAAVRAHSELYAAWREHLDAE